MMSGRCIFSIRSMSFSSSESMYSSFTATIPMSSLWSRGGMMAFASSTSLASNTSAPASRKPDARSLSVTMTNLYIHEFLPEVFHREISGLAARDDPYISDLVVLRPEVPDEGGNAQGITTKRLGALHDKIPLQFFLDHRDLLCLHSGPGYAGEEPVPGCGHLHKRVVDRIQDEHSIELFEIELRPPGKQEFLCLLWIDVVPDHPQHRLDVHDIDLDGKDVPDHRVVGIRGFNRTECFLVIIPVEGTFKYAKISAPGKLRECRGEWFCPGDAPRAKQIDYCLGVLLPHELGSCHLV